MARFADDERDLPPARRTVNPLLLVMAVVGGGLLLAGCVAVGGFALLWSQVESGRPKPTEAQEAKAAYTREGFRALVIGKTEAEVIAAVGEPDGIQGGGDPIWYYHGRTRDPVTGTIDGSVLVILKDGKVVRVI